MSNILYKIIFTSEKLVVTMYLTRFASFLFSNMQASMARELYLGVVCGGDFIHAHTLSSLVGCLFIIAISFPASFPFFTTCAVPWTKITFHSLNSSEKRVFSGINVGWLIQKSTEGLRRECMVHVVSINQFIEAMFLYLISFPFGFFFCRQLRMSTWTICTR